MVWNKHLHCSHHNMSTLLSKYALRSPANDVIWVFSITYGNIILQHFIHLRYYSISRETRKNHSWTWIVVICLSSLFFLEQSFASLRYCKLTWLSLQEEIYDETDEYVDVHNKIRINMLPPGKSLSPTISPGGGPLSQGLRRTPMASPFSPYHHGSSVLRSPASNHGQSPGILPTILSPGRSPTAQAPGQSSPTGSQVSINSNGQHKKDGES